MKASEFDESKYLNAKTAGKMNGNLYSIFDIKAAMVGQDEDAKRKMIIGFEGVEKALVVNKTNREILTEAYGDDTDEWKGKDVILHLVFVAFKGERTLSIQLEPVLRQKPGIQIPAGEPAPDAESISPEDIGSMPPLADETEPENHTSSPPLGSAEEHETRKGRKKR